MKLKRKKGVLQNLTQLSVLGGTAMWAWSRLMSDLKKVGGDLTGVSKKVAREARDLSSEAADTVTSSARKVYENAPEAIHSVTKRKEAVMSKPKKKFTFLKFLLVMGALIALAIFLLDKFLPKPYRDDELEDAWAGEDLEPSDLDPEKDGAIASASGANSSAKAFEEEETEEQEEEEESEEEDDENKDK